MRYLAISKATTFFAYAIFEDETLIKVDTKNFKEFDSVLRMKEIYTTINDLIKENQPSVVVTHSLDIQKIMKKNLERITEQKAMIKLACIQNKVLYLEARTSGWEKYIFDGKVTLSKKKEILKEYDFQPNFIDFPSDIADAIILGEAVAHKRIHV